MKLLVVSADGRTGAAQTDLPAIKATLEQLGVPYDVFVAADGELTRGDLVAATGAGLYHGVILETGSLVYFDTTQNAYVSAFDAAEWQTLWDYEAEYGVRQVTWYTYPFGTSDSFNYGLTPDPGFVDTQVAPLTARLTAEGRSVFGYLNGSSPLTFRSAWVYVPQVADPATTTPLLTTDDGAVIVSTHRYADGRENLAVTADNAAFLVHSQLLSYGLVNWVTGGLFLGERHVNLDVQIDDLLTDDDMWDPSCSCDVGPNVTTTPFRMSGADFNATIGWQSALRSSSPLLSSVTLEWAFNGEGASGIFSPDTLTPAVQAGQQHFNFVNHTYTHQLLDAPLSYGAARDEIRRNNTAAQKLGLKAYWRDSLVQPDISGLGNPEFLRAAVDTGVKYLISDASRAGWGNPTPNAGRYSTFQPSLLIIPRRANNLFYNVRDPAAWVDEFNCYYSHADPRPCLATDPVTGETRSWKFFQTLLTYDEILDWEANALLSYMLRWDLDPWMFHQPNTGTYDGTRSLLGDLLDRTLAKYAQAYTLPVRNLPQSRVGALMAERMAYDSSGASAVLTPCTSIELTTAKAAVVPLTGVSVSGRLAARPPELYGGQTISTVKAPGGGTRLTLPVSC
ncbi:MAG TPA: hypothetical protein VFR63_13405 [Gaiellaceae bacterium]|nr:hypothetical protein [Gaiellaceae bacterium]